MRHFFYSIVALVVTLLPAAGFAERPLFPRLLPDSTVLMLRMDDAAKFRQTLKSSSFGKLLVDPQMQPFVEQLVGDFGSWVAEQGKSFQLQLGELVDIPQGEVAIALIPTEASPAATDQGERPRPSFPFDIMILLDAKEQATVVKRLIESMEVRAKERMQLKEIKVGEVTIHSWSRDDRRNFAWCQREGAFVISNNQTRVESLLDLWTNPASSGLLASKQSFAAALTPCIGNGVEIPQLTFYLDPVGLIKAAGRSNPGMQVGLQMLEPLGLSNIRAIGATALVGGKEFDSLLQAHLVLDGARKGVLSLVQPESGDLRPELWVPDDVAQYSSLRWNGTKTLDGAERLAEMVAGKGYWENNVERTFVERLGSELKADIVEQWTGRTTMLRWFEPPARLGSQVMLFAAEVKDPEVMEKTIEKIMERFPIVGEREKFGGAYLYRLPTPEFEIDEKLMRRGQPHLMLMDRYVFFSDSRPLLEKVLRTSSDGSNRLINRPEFDGTAVDISLLLGNHEPFYMSFDDPAESLRSVYGLAKSNTVRDRLKGMGDRFAPAGMLEKALLSHDLPPFAVVSQYFAPGGAAAYNEPTGLHLFSFSSRPIK